MTNDLVRRLVAFAEKNEKIIALMRGNDPEDDIITRSIVYYFITEGEYNAERSDKISQLDIDIAQEGHTCTLGEWPDANISDYPFLGKTLWKR